MHIKTQQFEGPLTLLLNLIEQEKLDISEISLASITDQFLQVTTSIEKEAIPALLSFLEIASQLIAIKTRLLLPYLEPEENEDSGELIERLALYKKYLDQSRELYKQMCRKNMQSYPKRTRGVAQSAIQKQAFKRSVTLERIHDTCARLYKKRIADSTPKSVQSIRRTFNIQEKINFLINKIKQVQRCTFNELFYADTASRTEIIVSFLALLELCKYEHIVVHQTEPFHHIVIEQQTL